MRCIVTCMLAVCLLGGCGNYMARQEVKSKHGKPDLVRYVSGQSSAFALYDQGKPSGLGAIDWEFWFYIHRQQKFVVVFQDDQYEARQLSVLELLNCQRQYNDLVRKANPLPEAAPRNDSQPPPDDPITDRFGRPY